MRRLDLSRAAALVLAGGVLAGCSGGTTSTLAITPLNAEEVAAQAAGGVQLMAGMAEMVESFSTVFDDAGAQVVACDSGNASISVNDTAPVGQLSTGDRASVTFNGCVLDLPGGQLTLDGSLMFTATQVTGAAPGPLAFALSCSFGSLTVTGFGSIYVVDGAFTLEVDTPDGIQFASVVSGSFFSVFAQGEGQTLSGTWRDFAFERTLDTDTGAYTVDMAGRLSSSALGGEVVYETLSTFSGIEPAHPSAGSIRATGAFGSSVTLVALDDVNVELRVDLDGDGHTELTIPTTWDALAD